jgi:hypothetical protein
MGTLDGQALTDFVTDWRRVLFEADYLAPGWPREYGGAGLSALEQVIIGEEFAKAGVPTGGPNDVFGIQMLGNTLLQWGTDEQKGTTCRASCQRRGRVVSGLLRAQRRQRPVEPRPEGTARRRPVDPQRPEDLDLGRPPRRPHLHPRPHRPRCPASQGHLVPARRHAPARHRGAPDQDDQRRERVQRGVLHRRRHAEGRGRRRDQQRLGRRDDAARLRARRGRRHRPIRFQAEVDRLLAARQGVRGVADDPRIRQRLAQCYAKVQIMRFNGMRVLTQFLAGHHPGPDARDLEALLERVPQGDHRAGDRHPRCRGDGAHRSSSVQRVQADDAGAPNSSWSWVGTFLNARAGTIYAGSSQVQRNIIGEMVLGLPKEPPLSPRRPGARRAAVARRPDLWSTRCRAGRRTTPPGWWRRRPFLPVPGGAYLHFRTVTQYGIQIIRPSPPMC